MMRRSVRETCRGRLQNGTKKKEGRGNMKGKVKRKMIRKIRRKIRRKREAENVCRKAKASKNGRTIREDARIIRRGVREFERILPGQMRYVLAKSILGSCIPYITVLLSARILDELTQGKNRERLFWLCLLCIGAAGLLSALKYVFEAKIAVGYSYLFSAHEIYLTEKAHRLPYELLERPEVRSLREQVSGSINLSGAGMASLYWDMEVVFTNLCQTAAALALCIDFFRGLLAGGAGKTADLRDFVTMLLVLGLLTAVCSVVSCRMTAKRFDVSFEVFENGAKYNRYGEFYTMNYLPDENAATDVRIFRQEDIILRESKEKCYRHFAEGKRKEMRAVNRYDGTKLLCTCVCGAAVYALVGAKALQGAISAGSIVAAYAAVTMLISALSELSQIITDLRNNNEHLLNFFRYMELPENEENRAECAEGKSRKKAGKKQSEEHKEAVPALIFGEEGMPAAAPRIEFSHVSFRYPGSESWALSDVCLSAAAGEKLALVGENGSGKTTLIKLLCRLYRPTEGKILLDGRDIWSYPWEEYREKLAAVFQDFSLFAFSLAENVAAAADYDADRVKRALKQAGLEKKLASLPQGIRQPLSHAFSEDGTDLSGGEAQKTAIARAIYKDAGLMLLDEPTAALDPYAEAEIYENFHYMAEGRTVFSVSHRLSSCRGCDRVAVLDHGKIVQLGTHEELVGQTDKKYAALWRAQAQYYS